MKDSNMLSKKCSSIFLETMIAFFFIFEVNVDQLFAPRFSIYIRRTKTFHIIYSFQH